MARKRKAAAQGKATKRNPMARALKSGLFQQKVVERPERPRRRPKHKKPLEDAARDAENED